MKSFLAVLVAVVVLTATFRTSFAGTHSLVYTIDGSTAGDRLGHGVAGAGDVDRDGYDDFIVGAYYGNQSRAGYAKVYSGKTGKLPGSVCRYTTSTESL